IHALCLRDALPICGGRAHERLDALHLVAVTELRADHVEPRRRTLAGVGLAVPGESRGARFARTKVDLAHELAIRGADLHLHGVGADGKPYGPLDPVLRSEEHTSELQSRENLVCRLLLEKKKLIESNKKLFIQV